MATRGLDHWADILVVVLYFVFVLAVGMWIYYINQPDHDGTQIFEYKNVTIGDGHEREKSVFRQSRGSVKNYFLAGRSISWFPVGASLFSSNIGSEHFVGLAGTGAAAGIAMISYEWMSMPLVLLLGWLFLPVYTSAGVFTLPEYMEKRFGGQKLRIYLSVLALVLYIVTKLAVSIFAGALFIQLALGWDMYVSIVALLFVTGIYTILGGLAAVIYTDTLQTIVMTIGSFALVGISFHKIGGFSKLESQYMKAVPSIRNMNSTCGYPRDDAFHIFRDPITSDNPWPGLLLQSSIGCLWYWCCDQVIVQRSLAAKNLTHAKGGSIVAGYLKLLPLFMMIFPGMISRALYPDDVACVDPDECKRICDNPVGCSNIAYPKLVLELLPFGVRGLLMAVMLSAIMSSLTSIFNSSSTLFTMDLWRRMRPRANERELLIVGRIFIVIMCGISILWIPLVRSSQGGQLFNYIQAVQGYLGTPIGALFTLAVFWKRMNEHGAFWGIAAGHLCGVIRMAIDLAYPAPDCGEPETRPPILLDVHYSYFGSLTIVVTSVVIVAVSLLTKAQSEEEIQGVTWWTRIRSEGKKNKDTDNDPRDIEDNKGDIVMETKNTASDDTDKADNKRDSANCENGLQEQGETTTKTSGPSRSVMKRWCDVICGMPDADQEQYNPQLDKEKTQEYLKESSRWRNILNFNAAFALILTAFLFGFYR